MARPCCGQAEDRGVKPLLRQLDPVADAQAPRCRFVHEVAAKHDVAGGVAPVGRERAERLPTAGCGDLVGGGDDAAAAAGGAVKHHSADAEASPRVLGVGFTAGHDEAGPKTVHRHRCVEASVQVGERLLGYDQEGKAVGETHFVRGVRRKG